MDGGLRDSLDRLRHGLLEEAEELHVGEERVAEDAQVLQVLLLGRDRQLEHLRLRQRRQRRYASRPRGRLTEQRRAVLLGELRLGTQQAHEDPEHLVQHEDRVGHGRDRLVLWRRRWAGVTVTVFMRSRSSAEEGWLSRSMERERPRDCVMLWREVSPEPVMIFGSWSEESGPCEEEGGEPLGTNDDGICCVTLGVGI